MAGYDPAMAAVVSGLIEGDPLDAAAERKARTAGWKFFLLILYRVRRRISVSDMFLGVSLPRKR